MVDGKAIGNSFTTTLPRALAHHADLSPAERHQAEAICAPLRVPAGTPAAGGKNKTGSSPANPLESLRRLLSSCVGDCRWESLILGRQLPCDKHVSRSWSATSSGEVARSEVWVLCEITDVDGRLEAA